MSEEGRMDGVIHPPTVGEAHACRAGKERRLAMVLSLMPADSRPEVLERLYEIAAAAAAAEPNAEKNMAVGLRVSFILDPRDVRAFIEGRRSDLKTWLLPEDLEIERTDEPR